MRIEHVQLLRQALRAQPLLDEEAPDDLAIEKMGDAAFDWIAREVRHGSLKPEEAIRGLRLMSRLTRQFCVQRKGELLDLTIGLAVNGETDRNVRSAAAQILIVSAQLAKSLADVESAFKRSSAQVEDEVVMSLRRAVELGLTPSTQTLANAFFSSSSRT